MKINIAKKNIISYKLSIIQILICLFWSFSIILDYVRAAVMRLPFIGNHPDIFIYLIFATFIFFSFKNMVSSILWKDIVFCFLLCLLVFSNLWLFPDNLSILRYSILQFLSLGILFYLLGRIVIVKDLIRLLYLISVATILCRIVYSVFFETPMDSIQAIYEGNMNGAYNLLPHLCLVSYFMVLKHRPWDIILSILGFLFLIFLGNRGSIICFILFIFLYLILNKSHKFKIITFITSFILGMIVFISNIFNDLIYFFYTQASTYGLSVRLFNKYLSNDMFDSSGRDIIYNQLYQAIIDNPIFGNGIAADRLITGIYAHNLAIELWVEFGIILGTILLLLLFFIIIRGYIKAKDSSTKAFILLLFCCSVLKLFLSGSYLEEPYLFMLIGICFQSGEKCIINK